MPRTYSAKLVERIKNANPEKVGVRLGRLCVKHNIPVSAVAARFKVAKPTVYSWFAGNSEPINSLHVKAEKLVEFLESQSAAE